MTKSTITREQRINEVKELIANAEEWAGYYEHPIHDKPQREMFEGMARVMAEHLAELTAMDSEPVAWTWQHLKQWHVTNDEERARDLAWDGVKIEPLYRHAQPAPELATIVERLNLSGYEYEGGEVTPQNAAAIVDILLQQLDDAVQGRNAQLAPVVPVVPDFKKLARELVDNLVDCGGLDEGVKEKYLEWAEKTCRAAMLAAAPQSPGGDHATVPGKWIPVSERLPEDNGRYWCYVEEQNDLGKSHYQWNCSWNGDRWWVESEGGGIVTHWMPLPAAPQEVNRE
ncbi:DUF551 domain-containing protein [Klebsiella pneumoniae]|uniref:DUF551 domain-containing protein n=1 Tax=Klebsiella pneumoniae TaxID=573 RepID=UPI002155CF17|nr:DUF551 domain-containing protein [Klebsiella pneumoniae]MDG5059304.1 DUF551 domain-containing protein [Klebsiella pneumoniae]